MQPNLTAICKNCHNPFTRTHDDVRLCYCSPSCSAAMRGNRQIVDKNCERCGKAFQTTKPTQRFCNFICRNKRTEEQAIERFWKFVNKNGPIVRPELGPCWLWTGNSSCGGYGKYKSRSLTKIIKEDRSHRIAWVLTNGPIPDGMQICHKCDDGRCANPDHLFIGSQLDNMRDKVQKGRHRSPKGEQCWKAILSERDVREIREKYATGLITQAALAAQYGIKEKSISEVVRRRNWAHVV